MGKVSSEDVFSILVGKDRLTEKGASLKPQKRTATDQHLGFMEKDPGRKDDSFRSFEEILQIGLQHKVDFVLFGGDLFHDNKPSRPTGMRVYYCVACVFLKGVPPTVVRTMELMRKYTWNDRPVQFELLSNQRTNFPPIRFEGKDYSHPANFLDANINVGFPVFAIHGNHDDPSGVRTRTMSVKTNRVLSLPGGRSVRPRHLPLGRPPQLLWQAGQGRQRRDLADPAEKGDDTPRPVRPRQHPRRATLPHV